MKEYKNISELQELGFDPKIIKDLLIQALYIKGEEYYHITDVKKGIKNLKNLKAFRRLVSRRKKKKVKKKVKATPDQLWYEEYLENGFYYETKKDRITREKWEKKDKKAYRLSHLKCEMCGYNAYPILNLHHKDCDHKNR